MGSYFSPGAKPRHVHVGSASFFTNEVRPASQQMFSLLNLSDREQRQLWKFFVKTDKDGSGEISVTEFHAFVLVDATPFTERVFAYFDLDGSGLLNFHEFVCGVWSFCTNDARRIVCFCLNLFDVDKSGTLDSNEMCALLRMLHGERGAEVALHLPDNNPGTVEWLLEQNEIRPGVLRPAFDLRDKLRSQCLGTKFWRKLTVARTRRFGATTGIEDILLRDRKASGEQPRNCDSDVPKDALGTVQESHGSTKSPPRAATPGAPAGNASTGPSTADDGGAGGGNILDVSAIERRAMRAEEELENAINKYEEVVLEAEAALSGKRKRNWEEQACLKNTLQETLTRSMRVNELRWDEAEQKAYKHALHLEKAKADIFFSEKEGRKYIRIVGKESARQQSTRAFGLVRKKEVLRGMMKAKMDYTQKKQKGACQNVKKEYDARRRMRAQQYCDLRGRFDLLTLEEQSAARWQWQEIRVNRHEASTIETTSGRRRMKHDRTYFYCPVTRQSTWERPNISNYRGMCEDKICNRRARLRCAKCDLELCDGCDFVMHSVGPAKRHPQRQPIPYAEVEWRLGLAAETGTLSDENIERFIQSFCRDFVEIARRGRLWA